MIRVYKNRKYKAVKNLGWLLRNWKEIESFRVMRSFGPNVRHDCYLIAQMRDGRRFITTYASYSILYDFIRRPVFFGLPIRWRNERRTVEKHMPGFPTGHHSRSIV